MNRYWLLTSTFYGNWLPGDPRGFVSRVRDVRPEEPVSKSRREHDSPRTEYDANLPGLARAAQSQLRDEPVCLTYEQALVLLAQFQETAEYRGWDLRAVAIMSNHIHLVVGVPSRLHGKRALGDFKAYGSRSLNEQWERPSGTWWTEKGSTRPLPTRQAIENAVIYVVYKQTDPLVVWLAEPTGNDEVQQS